MEQPKSRVYIRIDDESRIVECDGGYTIENITDFSQWIYIGEGEGDRYNLCQSNYFDALYTDDDICRYKYVDGECVLRSDEEIEYDRQHRPEPYDELQDAKSALGILGVSE